MSELLLKKGEYYLWRNSKGEYVKCGTDRHGKEYSVDNKGNRTTYG